MAADVLEKRGRGVLAWMFVCVFVLTACSRGEDGSAEHAEAEESESIAFVLPGDDEVLVRIDGDSISRYDLDQAMMRMLGPEQAFLVDAAAEDRILESLVMSRVIAGAAEDELGTEEKARLDRQIKDYREQLLVKLYLREHADPQPVTQEMVREYYERHPEQFGGRTIRHYEMLTTKRRVEGDVRQQVIEALSGVSAQQDWQVYADKLKTRGLPVERRSGRVHEGLLDKQIQAALNGLSVNETSRPIFVNGMPYVLRIVKEETRSPRPLAEVGAEIRKSLLPIQLRKSIEQVADELMSRTEIEYATGDQGDETR